MRTTSTLRADDRAVSDVVGYVLIFSLITVSVGVITVGGFSALQDRQDAERINNAERAFDVLAGNVEDVYRDGAPSRATEMRLSGGTLRYGEPTDVTLRKANNTDINWTAQITPIVYSDSGTEIVYEAGAIIRDERDGSVVLRSPPYRFGPERTMLPLIRTTRSAGGSSVSFEGTIRVESARTSIDTDINPELADPSGDLELEVDSERQDAWNRYLERIAESEASWSHSNGTLTFDTEAVSAPRFRVQLRFVR